MALLLTLPVGELKRKERKANNIYICKGPLQTQLCPDLHQFLFNSDLINESECLSNSWETLANIWRSCKPKHGTVNNNVPPSMKSHFPGKAPGGYLALFKVIFESFESCSFHWQHSWHIRSTFVHFAAHQEFHH